MLAGAVAAVLVQQRRRGWVSGVLVLRAACGLELWQFASMLVWCGGVGALLKGTWYLQPAGQLATAPAFLHANPWPAWQENKVGAAAAAHEDGT